MIGLMYNAESMSIYTEEEEQSLSNEKKIVWCKRKQQEATKVL